jgi:hypothetical protein
MKSVVATRKPSSSRNRNATAIATSMSPTCHQPPGDGQFGCSTIFVPRIAPASSVTPQTMMPMAISSGRKPGPGVPALRKENPSDATSSEMPTASTAPAAVTSALFTRRSPCALALRGVDQKRLPHARPLPLHAGGKSSLAHPGAG